MDAMLLDVLFVISARWAEKLVHGRSACLPKLHTQPSTQRSTVTEMTADSGYKYIVVGGRSSRRQHPFFFASLQPSSPLPPSAGGFSHLSSWLYSPKLWSCFATEIWLHLPKLSLPFFCWSPMWSNHYPKRWPKTTTLPSSPRALNERTRFDPIAESPTLNRAYITHRILRGPLPTSYGSPPLISRGFLLQLTILIEGIRNIIRVHKQSWKEDSWAPHISNGRGNSSWLNGPSYRNHYTWRQLGGWVPE